MSLKVNDKRSVGIEHPSLIKRDLPDQHPIGAITGLGARLTIDEQDITSLKASTWKAPVSTAADLPTVGNSYGDGRVVISEKAIYVWNDGWTKISGGGAGGSVNDLLAKAVIYDSLSNKIVVTLSKGLYEIDDVHVRKDIDFISEIPAPSINTNYYIYIDKSGVTHYNMNGIIPIDAIFLTKIAVAATLTDIVFTDERPILAKGGGSLNQNPVQTSFQDLLNDTTYVDVVNTQRVLVSGGSAKLTRGSIFSDQFDDTASIDLPQSTNITVAGGDLKLNSAVTQGAMISKPLSAVAADSIAVRGLQYTNTQDTAMSDIITQNIGATVQSTPGNTFALPAANRIYEFGGSGKNLYCITRDLAGNVITPYTIIYTDLATQGVIYSLSVAVDATNGIAHFSFNLQGNSAGWMWIQLKISDWSLISRRVIESTTTNYYSSRTAIWVNPVDGRTWIVYCGLSVTFAYYGHLLRIYDSVGTLVTQENLNLIADAGNGEIQSANIVHIPSMNRVFIVAWFGATMMPSGAAMQVQIRQYDYNGAIKNIQSLSSGVLGTSPIYNSTTMIYDGGYAYNAIAVNNDIVMTYIRGAAVTALLLAVIKCTPVLDALGTISPAAANISLQNVKNADTFNNSRHTVHYHAPTNKLVVTSIVEINPSARAYIAWIIPPDPAQVVASLGTTLISDAYASRLYCIAAATSDVVYMITMSPTASMQFLRMYGLQPTKVKISLSGDGIAWTDVVVDQAVVLSAPSTNVRVKITLTSPTTAVTPTVQSYSVELWNTTTPGNGDLVSTKVTSSSPIVAATITSSQNANAGQLQWYLTNDGGANWIAATLGSKCEFPNPQSTDLRVKAHMAFASGSNVSPVIYDYTVVSTDSVGYTAYASRLQTIEVNALKDRLRIDVIDGAKKNKLSATVTDTFNDASGIDVAKSANYTYDAVGKLVIATDTTIACNIISTVDTASITPVNVWLVAYEDFVAGGTITYYISRDGGATFTKVDKDVLVNISSQPNGSNMVAKAVISGGAKLLGWGYGWY